MRPADTRGTATSTPPPEGRVFDGETRRALRCERGLLVKAPVSAAVAVVARLAHVHLFS